jgi:large subunit ribosomal protein L18
MARTNEKTLRRERIKHGIRKKVRGTTERPRLSVFRSNNDIYAQIIDDVAGKTLVSCSSRLKALTLQPLKKTEKSVQVGKLLAEKAKAAGIQQVVFDRNGFRYHGRIKALADSAREAGLIF